MATYERAKGWKLKTTRTFGPNNAVHWLVRSASNCANRVNLLGRLRLALVASGDTLEYGHHLSQISRRASINKGNVGSQAKSIDVLSSINIIQSVQDHVEFSKI